ncbi:hypothetical protein [Roseofilum casamattae]|uniref:Uncharacterized protein n=1 Tax=Roseofilum casamattae BLCC-M143 TaxID=3022442 RepID=A0ABT7BUH1_9CYAN|nr:hypothetical protein [Roseofilum casamattae]MDJ1182735.1 hypothetical protein [Roseofilum casamattae BLCC-M143]
MAKTYISSEQYRQMLVKEGDRRFQQWHTQYLDYQKHYLKDMETRRQQRSGHSN